MIIWKNDNITLEQNDGGYYAIFKRVCYPSGTTAYWQQMTKWYFYRKCAEREYEKMLNKEKVGV